MHRRYAPARCAVAALAALALVATTQQGDAEEPSKRALVMAKVLSYERRLAETKGSSLGVAILYAPGDGESRKAADGWARAFATLGDIRVHGVPLDVVVLPFDRDRVAATVREKGIDVLLACDGVSPTIVSSLAMEKQILSAADTRAGVEQGLSLSVTVEQGKPHIVINLRTARAEGAQFSAKLLQLAEVL